MKIIRFWKFDNLVEVVGDFGKRHVLVAGGFIEISDVEEIIEKVREVDEKYGTISQIFDAKTIAGKNHIHHASKLALESLENGRAFAKSSSIELTCWVAGMRQINKSLERVGVKEDSNEIAIVTIGEKKVEANEAQDELIQDMGVEKNEQVLEVDEEKKENLMEIYSISEKQLENMPIEKMIMEKVALLSLEQ